MLKMIRVTLAIIVGVTVFYAFNAITNSIFSDIAVNVAKIQFIPAILSGSVVVIISTILFTLIFGRIYCSVICPLGIFQDVIRAVILKTKKLFKVKRNNKNRGYKKPLNVYLRYATLVLTAISIVVGVGVTTNLLDPYSLSGVIATHLFKPVSIFFNNITASTLNYFENYSIFRVSSSLVSVGAFIFSLVLTFILIAVVNYRGRLWCNSLCPVGAALSLLSKYSLLKINIDQSKCNKCRACALECKANCIDEQNYTVDSSRCVDCFNCLNKCKRGAISYSFKKSTPKPATIEQPTSTTNEPTKPEDVITSRGAFLALAASTTVAPKMKRMRKRMRLDDSRYPLPPGAISIERFEQKCTGCQLCISRCPTHVLKPAMFSRGINSFMQPYMEFGVHKFCGYECTQCMDVCPNNALVKVDLEEKKLIQVGIVQFNRENCVVVKKNKHCGACAEHCPTGAVVMTNYINGLTIPELHAEYCIGCGGCESICPEIPNAIFIVGSREQGRANPPHIEESVEVDIDSFGF